MREWNTYGRNVLVISLPLAPAPLSPLCRTLMPIGTHTIILTGGIVGNVCIWGKLISQESVPGPPRVKLDGSNDL